MSYVKIKLCLTRQIIENPKAVNVFYNQRYLMEIAFDPEALLEKAILPIFSRDHF
jgi:hypothetical protein